MSIDNGIFLCNFKKIELLNLEIAQKCVQDRLELIAGTAYPSFFDITKVRNTTKEARDFIAKEGNELVTATALLVTSPVLRMMANFYIAVNKPKNPSRMFTDKRAALDWLAQYKANYCLVLLLSVCVQASIAVVIC
ncbi:STAS/SEC14 domain-containing protein [Pontibacter qinzhouensis]|uniref:STAS/SEC14 domain-containing protein n=1 Tax=Pontibacter qinzhouensis TaxID=2603253 RepID=A0A5C8KD03_9BACT|nr:STAS/SEC14 domain-containing protein [Pontibacter qinzhouensis]TXK52162.1 STAS/SEC14 domain-containing protein [Pontibacter qinzhouensis]